MTELTEPQTQNMLDTFLLSLKELASPYPSVMLPSWPNWNEITGGFRMREFSILCGSTGTGKTSFVANLSAQLLLGKVKHFVMSVETGHTDFMKRIMSALEGEDLNTGSAIPVEKLIRHSAKFLKYFTNECIEFSLYEDRVPVEQLVYELTYMAQVKDCKIAIIDNLNFFLEVTRSSESIVEMDRVIHELIILCKKIDMHVIMIMHPKKTDNGRVESEFDIKGSSTAVQEAHNVFLFNRPPTSEILKGNRLFNERDLKIAKMRRRGFYVGKTLVFECKGATYQEKGCT